MTLNVLQAYTQKTLTHYEIYFSYPRFIAEETEAQRG